MARGTTLTELLDQYRAECRLSLNVAHNVSARDQQVAHIQRTQNWLWEDFDWPLLRVERTLSLAAGQRFYSPPNDMKVDRIQTISVYYAGGYQPLKPGIDRENYSLYDPLLDQRQWPPQRWGMAEDNLDDGEQVEIWPVPEQDVDLTTREGTLSVWGIRNLRPLVADSDRADIDDRLLILFCASEILASRGDKDANSKLQMANKRYLKLRGHQMPRKKFTLFGVGQPDPRRTQRVPIAVYNSTS